MPISRCLFTCPVCGSATEPLIKGTNDENEDRSKLLGLVLGELDQQGVCSGCNAPLPSSAPCTFQDLKLNALVYVGFPIADALASWRSNPVSNRIPPMFVRSRLALKTAIARLSNFERTIVDQVPNGDWITIMCRWLQADDIAYLCRATSPDARFHMRRALRDLLTESIEAGSPEQVRLRALAGSPPFTDDYPPPESEVTRSSAEDSSDSMLSLLRTFLEQSEADWDSTLSASLHLLDDTAVELCWHSTQFYRRQPNQHQAALATGKLGMWLSVRMCSVPYQAESAYQLGATLTVAGYFKAAVDIFELALALYLESLQTSIALECFKQLGDLFMLSLENHLAAREWYERGADLARATRELGHLKTLSTSLARAAYLAGDYFTGETAAQEVLQLLAGDSKEEHQLRLAAWDAMRNIKSAQGDDAAALELTRHMVGQIRLDQDWMTLASMADALIKPAVTSGDWTFADDTITETLTHLDSTAIGEKRLYQPDQSQLMTAEVTGVDLFRLWRLGGRLACMFRRFPEADSRFEHASALGKDYASPDEQIGLFEEWAEALLCAGQIDRAITIHELLLSAQVDDQARAERCLLIADQFLTVARGPTPLEIADPAERASFTTNAAEAAATFYAKRTTLLLQVEATVEELGDNYWTNATALALKSWLLRRELSQPIVAVQSAEQAVALARQNGSDCCLIEALDVLYFSQRDAGDLQNAARTLLQIATLSGRVDILQSITSESANLRRLVRNTALLPGVALQVPESPVDLTGPPPAEAEGFSIWLANSVRSFGVGMLALREHGRTLTPEKLQTVAENSSAFVPRNLGSLRGLGEQGLSWHMGRIREDQSPFAMPDRWVDGIANGYLILAALSGIPCAILGQSELDRLTRSGYEQIFSGLVQLGLYPLALQYCPRPSGCEQPTSSATLLVPMNSRVTAWPEAWQLAHRLSLTCGDLLNAEAIAEAAVRWAEADGENAWSIRFRLARATQWGQEGRASECTEECNRCRDLLVALPDDNDRATLAREIDLADLSLNPDSLRRRERELLLFETPDGVSKHSRLDDGVKDLLSLAKHLVMFGRFSDAEVSIDKAAQVAGITGIKLFHRMVLAARADLAHARGNHQLAIEKMTQCLDEIEGEPEPELSELGRTLGLLGLYRCADIYSSHGAQFENADLPKLRTATEELERSIAIHRKIGSAKDTMVNLINLGMTYGLRLDIPRQITCYLEALTYGADTQSAHGPTIHYPSSYVKIWINLASACETMNWYPEAPVIARYCLNSLERLFLGLIVDANKLESFPEQELIVPQAINSLWEWVRGPAGKPLEKQVRGGGRRYLTSLRSEIQERCVQAGMVFDKVLYPLPRTRPWWRGARKEALRIELLELAESTKARILRERLGGARPLARALPDNLNDRELKAYSGWMSIRKECTDSDNSNERDQAIAACWRQYEELAGIWSEMEAQGGAVAEFARLRSGRIAPFETIRVCLRAQ